VLAPAMTLVSTLYHTTNFLYFKNQLHFLFVFLKHTPQQTMDCPVRVYYFVRVVGRRAVPISFGTAGSFFNSLLAKPFLDIPAGNQHTPNKVMDKYPGVLLVVPGGALSVHKPGRRYRHYLCTRLDRKPGNQLQFLAAV